MFLKFVSLSLVAVVFFVSSISSARADEKCVKPWVFFDLGQTIADTDTNKYNPMFYMPNAYEYLQGLNKLGHKTGMIIDIPGGWGRDAEDVKAIKDLATAKWVRVLKFLNPKKYGAVPGDDTGWAGREFEIGHFGTFTGTGPNLKFQGHVVLPMKDSERKDTGNPIVFVRALGLADKVSCEAVYMSEDAEQLKMAEQVGFVTYQVGVKGRPFYVPLKQIEEYIVAFKANKESVRADEEARAARSGNRPMMRTPRRASHRPGL